MQDVLEAMRDRAFAYRFLARAFRAAPDAAFLDSIEEAGEAGASLLPNYELDQNRQPRPELLRDMTADYNALFLGMSANPVSPFESVYTSEEGMMRGEACTDVAKAYRRFGVRVAESFDLPEDHVALEFELMAVLAEKAAEASECEDGTALSRLIADQQAFLEEHLAWVPLMTELVNRRAATGFYRDLAALADQTVKADAGILAECAECSTDA